MKYRDFNIKWSNIFKFNEKNDFETWKIWRMKLYIKIQRDFRLFHFVDFDIDYVKNHCENIVWNIIEIRANSMSQNFYFILKKMLQNMNIFFDFINIATKTRIKFKNFFFKQRFDEIFAIFIVRINAIMISIQWFDVDKCLNFQKLMLSRAKRIVWAMTNTFNYRKYCNECIKVIQNMNHQNFDNNNDKNDKQNFKFKFIYRNRENTIINKSMIRKIFFDKFKWEKNKWNIFRFNNHSKAKQKIIDKKYCSKCLIVEHRSTNVDVSCKNKSAIKFEKAISKFVVIDIKWASKNDDLDEEIEYFFENESKN